jgi:predicted DNA-binding transcriptional regulator YafY
MRNSYDPNTVETCMPILCQAIKADKLVEIDYDSLGRGNGVRVLEPYQILFRGRAFYLIAYSIEHQEYRIYRLDRISNVTITKQHFFPRTDYNPETLLAGKTDFDGDTNWYDIEIIFRGRAAKIVSTGKRFEGEQISKLADGCVRYKVRTQGLSEIAVWIAGYGVEAEVVAPELLRRRFAETGRYYLEVYGDSGLQDEAKRLVSDRIARLTHLKDSGNS